MNCYTFRNNHPLLQRKL